MEHADGWGLALRRNDTWTVKRGTTCAARCESYAGLDHEAVLAIAHIRKKTVGELSLANTHPFQRGRFVFAHNGTVDTTQLISQTAPEHTESLAGTTDSEKLFMFVLTQIDRAGEVTAGVRPPRSAHSTRCGSIGSASFLISDGEKLFAHRLGRALFTTQRRGVALIASEPLTDNDRWTEILDRQLVVLERPQPSGILAAYRSSSGAASSLSAATSSALRRATRSASAMCRNNARAAPGGLPVSRSLRAASISLTSSPSLPPGNVFAPSMPSAINFVRHFSAR